MASSSERKELESMTRLSFEFDDLGDQLLLDILRCLSLKSVHRCKCVSKRWYSLISDSYFSQQYTLGKPKYYPAQSHPPFSFAFLPKIEKKTPRVLGSCNGLVLCGGNLSPRFGLIRWWGNISHCFLCSPLTKQWIRIPQPPPMRRGLPVDPLIGFVCNDKVEVEDQFPSRIKYHVVCISSQCTHNNQSVAKIFSFDTMKWTESDVYFPSGFSFRNRDQLGVCCSGVLYWQNREFGRLGVFAYNLYKKIDQINFIYFPEPTNRYPDKIELIANCQGNLRLGRQGFDSPFRSYLEVWEHINGEWRLEYNNRVHDSLILAAIDAIDGDVVYVFVKGHTERMLELNLKKETYGCYLRNPGSVRSSLLTSSFVLPCWPTALPAQNQPISNA